MSNNNWAWMRILVLCGLMTVLLMKGGNPTLRTSTPVEDWGWEVDLDETIQQLWEAMDETVNQHHYNKLSASLAEIYDAKLFILLYQQMEVTSPGRRQELIDQQQDFLKDRSARVATVCEAYKGDVGGPGAAHMEFIALTRDRIESLGGVDTSPTPPETGFDGLVASADSLNEPD